MKKCYMCAENKRSDYFYKDIRSKDGLSSKCKACAKTFKSKDFRTKTEKTCPRCRNLLPIESFDLRSTGDGYQTACKTCRNLVKCLSKVGATWNWYYHTLKSQNGLCKICKEPRALQIDHCHATGKVRGLLCGPCNRGLGQFEDSTERLLAAADYLG